MTISEERLREIERGYYANKSAALRELIAALRDEREVSAKLREELTFRNNTNKALQDINVGEQRLQASNRALREALEQEVMHHDRLYWCRLCHAKSDEFVLFRHEPTCVLYDTALSPAAASREVENG